MSPLPHTIQLIKTIKERLMRKIRPCGEWVLKNASGKVLFRSPEEPTLHRFALRYIAKHQRMLRKEYVPRGGNGHRLGWSNGQGADPSLELASYGSEVSA